MGHFSSKSIKMFLRYADWIALNIIHLETLSLMRGNAVASSIDYCSNIVISNIVWIFCANIAGIYFSNKIADAKPILMRLGFAYFMLIGFETVSWYTTHVYSLPNLIIFDIAGFGLYLSLSRLIVLGLDMTVARNGAFRQKIAIIGGNKFAIQLGKELKKHNSGYQIVGFFDDKKSLPAAGDEMVNLGKIADSIRFAYENGITEIYSTILPEKNAQLRALAKEAEKKFIRFRFVPDFSEYVDDNAQLNFISETPVVTLRSEPLASASGQLVKRLFDILLSSFVIVFILSWLVPILGLLIKLDSKGPIFFRQIRTGERNKPFMCLKFRSLKVNAEADSKQVTRNDSRFTRLGKFLRKSNLDELPQFINVFMGQMSVVGSRPHMLKHTEDYSQLYDNYMLRHFMKPGLTGWAQVNGFRGEIKQTEQLVKRVEHDIWYMENWNIWLDLRIVGLTFTSMLRGDKNAF